MPNILQTRKKNVYVTSGARVAAAEENRKNVNVQLSASVYGWFHTVKYCSGSADVFLQICP